MIAPYHVAVSISSRSIKNSELLSPRALELKKLRKIYVRFAPIC
jgi:hypothetical protein